MSISNEEGGIDYQANIFSVKRILIIGTVFVSIVIVLNRFARYIFNNLRWFDCTRYWPTCISLLRIPGQFQIITAVVSLLFFSLSVIFLTKKRYRIMPVILIGLTLVITTNMIQGWNSGFITPIAGRSTNSHQYYHDAIRINRPIDFLSNYAQMQDELCVHSKTHPPGAVLAIYYLNVVLRFPALISIAMACISVSLTAIFLYKIVLLKINDKASAGYITFLYLLIPAVQIYILASIDSLVAAFMIGSLYYYISSRSVFRLGAALLFLILSSFLSFGFVFILPVMLIYDVITRRSMKGFVLITVSLILFYLLVYLLSGFNYSDSFYIASKLENPGGFYLSNDPLSYIFTRIESVLEILIFLGPFIFVLLWRGLKNFGNRKLELTTLSLIAISVFILMLLTGTYRTGETARIGLYLYPYLIFPVALLLKEMKLSETNKIKLLALTFVQSIMMQLLSDYFW